MGQPVKEKRWEPIGQKRQRARRVGGKGGGERRDRKERGRQIVSDENYLLNLPGWISFSKSSRNKQTIFHNTKIAGEKISIQWTKNWQTKNSIQIFGQKHVTYLPKLSLCYSALALLVKGQECFADLWRQLGHFVLDANDHFFCWHHIGPCKGVFVNHPLSE